MSNQRLDETGNRDPNKRLLQDDLERNNSSTGNGTLIGIAFVILLLAVMVLMYRANTEELAPAAMSSTATERSNAAGVSGDGTGSNAVTNSSNGTTTNGNTSNYGTTDTRAVVPASNSITPANGTGTSGNSSVTSGSGSTTSGSSATGTSTTTP